MSKPDYQAMSALLLEHVIVGKKARDVLKVSGRPPEALELIEARLEAVTTGATVLKLLPDVLRALKASSHALKSYAHGNAAMDLATGTAAFVDDILKKLGEK